MAKSQSIIPGVKIESQQIYDELSVKYASDSDILLMRTGIHDQGRANTDL